MADDEAAMVALGLGKNMVRSLRFWLDVSGVAVSKRDRSFTTTEFGRQLLGPRGADPFLEDVRTLWLLHWQIATRSDEPLFAWDLLLNRWPQAEFSRSTVLPAFRRGAAAQDKKLSDVTLEQHFDVFLHSYVPTSGRKGEVLEDNLDCPLVELELIQKIGERSLDGTGNREPVYAFRVTEKPGITPELFTFCVAEFWRLQRAKERTVSLRDIAVGPGGPGQVFKLPEPAIRERLETIEADSGGLFAYKESASSQHLVKLAEPSSSLLPRIFRGKVA